MGSFSARDFSPRKLISITLISFVVTLLQIAECDGIALPSDAPFARNYVPNGYCKLPLLPLLNSSVPQHGRDTFDQPIDHDTPHLGQFSESFLWNTTFWRPGAPIVLFIPGESRIDHFESLSRPDYSTVGVIAENLGAALLVLEHRYFGSSSPYTTKFTRANLQYLTVDNALKDIVRFADNFTAPWSDVPSAAKDVPWILIGGSYSAAQAGWIANIMPGTFWAYLSASPILQAIPSYWAAYLPFMEYTRKSCVRLLSSVIEFIDHLIETGDDENLQIIKTLFGLTQMKTPDFLWGLEITLAERSLSYMWQDNSTLETYCSWVEGLQDEDELDGIDIDQLRGLLSRRPQQDDKLIKPRADWAIRYEQTVRALHTFAKGFREHASSYLCFLGQCIDSDEYPGNGEPFDESDLWAWLLCNDKMGGYWTGAPIGATSTPLVSRFLTHDYYEKKCKRFYDGKSQREAKGGHQTAEAFNAYTGGWSPTNARRIIYSAGEMDIWREMSASAKLRPGGPLKSDPEKGIVVHLIKRGWHHSEMLTRNAELYEDVRRVRDQEVDQICRWVQQWPGYA